MLLSSIIILLHSIMNQEDLCLYNVVLSAILYRRVSQHQPGTLTLTHCVCSQLFDDIHSVDNSNLNLVILLIRMVKVVFFPQTLNLWGGLHNTCTLAVVCSVHPVTELSVSLYVLYCMIS